VSVAALKTAEWLIRPETQRIFAILDGASGRTRAVGGIVRDTILDCLQDHPDIDMATELAPDEVVARAKAAGIACYPTGIDHGTVTLRLGTTLVEVTTLRRDVETDGRHALVAFGAGWHEDASRRDFTLNAVYCDAKGALFDPLEGVRDAVAGKVRFIGDPASRIAEDGLRVFRFFRFSASHGQEHHDRDGLRACEEAVPQLGHLSRERVGSEMMRMLALPRIATTLRQMAAIGLLEVGEEALAALRRYQALGGRSAPARLALLAGGRLEEQQADWRLSNDTIEAARQITLASGLLEADRIGEAAYRFGEATVEGLAVAAAGRDWNADRLAESARVLAATIVPPFPLSGRDLLDLGMTPGPAIGQLLSRLERAWIDSGFALDRDGLLALMV
jgi:poly(A) polymerase